MTTTKDLPDYCYALLPENGQLIRINHGEMGYYPIKAGPEQQHVFGQEAEEMMELLNKAKGVTYSQREAMFAGSMFGWHVPGADPNHPCNQPPHARN